jgi:Rod binding domain-containing protein
MSDAIAPLAGSAGAFPQGLQTEAATARTAQDFEAFFITSIMENLFAGVGTDTLFGGGQSEGVYRSMLLQEYGKLTARSGGIGLAAAVQHEMLRAQEAAR